MDRTVTMSEPRSNYTSLLSSSSSSSSPSRPIRIGSTTTCSTSTGSTTGTSRKVHHSVESFDATSIPSVPSSSLSSSTGIPLYNISNTAGIHSATATTGSSSGIQQVLQRYRKQKSNHHHHHNFHWRQQITRALSDLPCTIRANNNNGCGSGAGSNRRFSRRNVIQIVIVLFVAGRLTSTFVMFEKALDVSSSPYTNFYYYSRIISFSSNGTMTAASSSSVSTTTTTKSDDDIENEHVEDDDVSSFYYELLNDYNVPYMPLSSSSILSSTTTDIRHAIQYERFDPLMLQLEGGEDQHNESVVRHQQQLLLQQQRQQRSRPPSWPDGHIYNYNINNSEDESISTLQQQQVQQPRRIVGNSTTIRIEQPDNDDDNHHRQWQELCQGAQLSKTSRIVITNALSISIGAPLTLLLYHQCHVKSIMIVDAMLPNLKQRRIRYMDDTFRILYRNIPGLKFTVPTSTAGLGKLSEDRSSSSLRWLESFRPTHIIHLEDFMSPNVAVWRDHMTKTGQTLYSIQNSILSMKQLLYYHQTRVTTNVLSILHITTVLPSSVSSSFDRNQQNAQESLPISTTMTNHIHHMLADYVQQQNYTTRNDNNNNNRQPKDLLLRVHNLQIPYIIYGPLVPNYNYDADDGNDSIVQYQNQSSHRLPSSPSLLYIDDAIVGVLQALQHQQQEKDISVGGQLMTLLLSDDSSNTTRNEQLQFQVKVYDHNQKYPYGTVGQNESSMQLHIESDNDQTLYKTTISRIHDLYGIYKTRFPCASSCWNDQLYSNNANTDVCDVSVVDTIYPISESITKHCLYVLYHINLDVTLHQIFEPPKELKGTVSKKVCRIAFVSETSVIVQNSINEQRNNNIKTKNNVDLDYNGQINVNGWVLIWMDQKVDAQSVEIDFDTLLRLEPSRFFASNVKKAMYTDSETIASTSDVALIHIMSNINRPARPQGYFTREYRSGLENVHRDLYHPPANARSVSFFASEVETENRPKNLGEYIQQRLSDMTESDIKKSRPINYYKQMSHWIQSDTNRPLRDGIGPILHVPWIWVTMNFFVHDLQSDVARIFRCTWYDAHLYWGTENTIPGTEDLSLAYVFAKQRLDGSIGQGIDNDGSWLPQLNKYTHKQTLIGDDTECFLRIMTSGSL